MKLFNVIIIFCLLQISAISIYSFQFTTVNGVEVSLSAYQGKKILLVNIASESPKASVQIPQLEQLYQLYKDSLIVIGFPSNDFGNEPRTNSELKLLLQNTYQASFQLSSLVGVKDSTGNTHALYKWLQHKADNGVMDVKITKDFQKMLIDKDGTIIGFFGSSIEPMDVAIQNAIKNN